MAKTALLIGWHPDVVNYEKWPDLTPEKLARGLEAERANLTDLGIEAGWLLVKDAESGAKDLADRLSGNSYDVVLIGAGVRKDDDHFLVFERLVNVIHEHAPQARIAFNTNPSDTAAAIQRWISSTSPPSRP